MQLDKNKFIYDNNFIKLKYITNNFILHWKGANKISKHNICNKINLSLFLKYYLWLYFRNIASTDLTHYIKLIYI